MSAIESEWMSEWVSVGDEEEEGSWTEKQHRGKNFGDDSTVRAPAQRPSAEQCRVEHKRFVSAWHMWKIMLIELEIFRHMYFFRCFRSLNPLAIWFSLLGSATISRPVDRMSFQLHCPCGERHHWFVCASRFLRSISYFFFIFSHLFSALCKVLISLDLDLRFGNWDIQAPLTPTTNEIYGRAHSLLFLYSRSWNGMESI